MKITLLLHEESVDAHEGISFRLNPAKKHEENPVMLPGEPHQWDSLQVCWPATVLYDEEDRKFKCWYSGLDALQAPGRRYHLAGYAESLDGIHWVKPELGLVSHDKKTNISYEGQKTNIVRTNWEYASGSSYIGLVFKNPFPGRPDAQKYVGYWNDIDRNVDHAQKKTLAYSPDGFEWTRAFTAYEVPYPISRQDISQILYDPDEADPQFRFKGYTQVTAERRYDGKPKMRHIGLVHGETFEKMVDAQERIVLEPEEGIDEELHFATVKKIGNTYLMLFESDRFSQNPIRGDLRLAVSTDGRKFKRIHEHEALVDRGAKGTWDENLLVTTTYAMQEVGDTVYIFYLGAPNLFNSWPPEYALIRERRGSMISPTYLGVALLPKDRYAYAAGPGRLTTLAFSCAEETGVWLNTDDIGLQVEAIDDRGETVAVGRSVFESRNTVYRKVIWDNGSPVGQIRLRITLPPQGRLYSIGID